MHHPFWMFIDCDTWHNNNLSHDILIKNPPNYFKLSI
jgi:hypothetical protein